MAKFDSKWKKRSLTVLSVALATTLSLGAFAACKGNTDTGDETDDAVSKTDTQLLKNGNFEFYSDKKLTDPKKKLNLINSPDSWTFTSGSPSSDTKSGIVDSEDWAYLSRSGGNSFFSGLDEENKPAFESALASAYAQWEADDVSAYDRLKFLDLYEEEIEDLDDDSDEAKLFAKYGYSIDFEDVEYLEDDIGRDLTLHSGADPEQAGSSVLMIHNKKTSDSVRGTAQYYTSSTTITLSAGTAAEVSVWVKTDKLVHYEDTELTARGGAYIGVTNTVGGTTLDQMQIYNISTEGEWKEYHLLIRASTFATSTFRIVLGLGQGSSDDRYYSVDGYAFFDDLTCKITSGSAFEEAAGKSGVVSCTVDSVKKEKQFDADSVTADTFALDLYAGFDVGDSLLSDASVALTEEVSGSNTYTSEKVDSALKDDNTVNFAGVASLNELSTSANAKVKNVYDNDFKDKFPFDNEKLVLLLSSNGAAYTAKLGDITLKEGERMLISFFAKTSKIGNGLTGAGAVIVDGENKTYLSSFDTTNLAAVDIDSKSDDPADKDIYKGWTQCFFFLENETDTDKTFHLELTYGPTSLVGAQKSSFGAGYAAFANFETKTITKIEYGYASTGDRAKKVSLTGEVAETKKFDSVSATDEKTIENGLALPANFRGHVGGSNFTQNNETDIPDEKPAGIDSGLLSSKYAKNYVNSTEAWKSELDKLAGGTSNPDLWWSNIFGNARQPLVIINRAAGAYGYFAENATVSASSYQRISLRVKASTGAEAHIYLTDVSSADKSGLLITPNLPGYTYWYDDEGNIVNMDPTDEEFDKEGEILYELQSNGLYKKANDNSDTYYANFYNYEEDSEGNKITKDGSIAFYRNGERYYAYYDEDAVAPYSVPVTQLPTDIVHYDYSDTSKLPGTEITVKGTGDWVTVNFYLHTGNEAKNYRLEVWSGSRDGKVTNPEGSYVFFDNYTSSSYSNYDSLLSETVGKIKDKLNEGKDFNDPDSGYLGDDDNLPKEYALYYTFTFYDSASYLRYDEDADTEKLGDPYGSYLQSGYEEQLVYLYYTEGEGALPEEYSFFLDYSATDVTVEKDDLSSGDDDTDTDTGSDAETDPANIWLLISSGILAVVLVFVIVLLIVRRLIEKFGKKAKIKPAKDKRIRPARSARNSGKDTAEDTEEPEPDED